MDQETGTEGCGILEDSNAGETPADVMESLETEDTNEQPENEILKRKSSEDVDEPRASKRMCPEDQIQNNSSSCAQQALEIGNMVRGSADPEGAQVQRGQSDGNAHDGCDRMDTSPSKSQSADLFFDELAGILQETGGISQLQDVRILEGLMNREQRLKHRWTLLTVTEQSSPDCQKRLVEGEGLQILERWLVEAREAKKPQFLTKIIKCLSALPVDFEALKKGSIGKTTGVLRRHDCASVKTAANELVSKWKSVVDKKRSKGQPIAGAAKVQLFLAHQVADGIKNGTPSNAARCGESLMKQLPVMKRTHVQDAQLLKRSLQENDQYKPNKQLPHKNRIPQECSAQENLSSILRALVSGPPRLPGTSVMGKEPEDNYPIDQDKTEIGVTVETEKSPRLSGGNTTIPNEACTSTIADREFKNSADMGPVRNENRSQSDPLQSQNAEAQKAGEDTRNGALSKLGTLSGTGDSTRVGSINTPFLPQRALAQKPPKAVRNAPSSPARSPNPSMSRKKVSWAPEEKLSSVRWFKMDDPPENVCKDSLYTEEESLAMYNMRSVESSHDPFTSAARLEHLNECQALRASRQLDTKERAPVMVSKVEWKKPPQVRSNPVWQIAFGGESKEKSWQSQREENVVAMLNAKNRIIPSNPIEPDAEPVHQDNAVRIPYTGPNKPEGNHPQPAYTKPLVLQTHGSISQTHGGGPRPILLHPSPGYVGQGQYIHQQVSLHRSGQPQTLLLLPSSVGNQQMIMPANSSLPMVLGNRPNQSILVPANGNPPLAIPGQQQQVLIPGNPHALQMQGPPVQLQLPLRNLADGQARVQQMVLSGISPGLCTQLHPGHHQQVVFGSISNHAQQPQQGLNPNLLMPDQSCQTPPNKMPGKGPG